MQLQFSIRNHTGFIDLYKAVTGNYDYTLPSYLDSEHIEVANLSECLSFELDDDCISVDTETQYNKTKNKIDS